MTDSSKELKHWLAFKHPNLCVFENCSKENQNLRGDGFMFQVYEICLSCLIKVTYYIGLPIIQTLEGNRKMFELLGVRVIESKII